MLVEVQFLPYITKKFTHFPAHKIIYSSVEVSNDRFNDYLSEKPPGHHHELIHSPLVYTKPFTTHRQEEGFDKTQSRLLGTKCI